MQSIALPHQGLRSKTRASEAGAGKQGSVAALWSQSCAGNVAVALCHSCDGAFKLSLSEGSLGVKLQIFGFQLEIGSSGTLRLKKAEKLDGNDSTVFSSVGKLVLTPAEM